MAVVVLLLTGGLLLSLLLLQQQPLHIHSFVIRTSSYPNTTTRTWNVPARIRVRSQSLLFIIKKNEKFQQERMILHALPSSKSNSNENDADTNKSGDSTTALKFSALMALCGAALGPFLDSYHSSFGVLKYESPITFTQLPLLGGSETHPALTTAWWVPELFGLAGFIIGWLYILLDQYFYTSPIKRNPTGPQILTGISLFTFQYWLSGYLYGLQGVVDREMIFVIMSVLAGAGFMAFDATLSGFITSLATAVGGPLIEVGLISTLHGHGGYSYNDAGETGFFPLWIVPVYFLGGPAVGNLARGFYSALTSTTSSSSSSNSVKTEKGRPNCATCNDTRAVECPNCDARGFYMSYGKKVQCNCCKGRGLVICRDCFNDYGDDPYDIENVRRIMSQIPD